MNGMNFFTWLRDGVRQSVLLGVSDAIETLGTPATSDELHPSVAGLLKVDQGVEATAAPMLTQGNNRPSGAGNRKRLGRSLKDLETEAAKAG